MVAAAVQAKWRAHDLDIPLQRRVDAVDGLTDDDDDNTDEEYEDLAEGFQSSRI